MYIPHKVLRVSKKNLETVFTMLSAFMISVFILIFKRKFSIF
jgi:hypothetical protein